MDDGPDPMARFARWLADAVNAGIAEPTAMSLATADREGRPRVRTVLLKGHGSHGFVFFTNYTSRKAADLEATGRAAVVFCWPELGRQVSAAGTVARTSADASDSYFASRERESQLAAWASHQSQVISGREVLERRLGVIRGRFAGGSVPRPPFWGGYLLTPADCEFWESRPHRLHDRTRYVRVPGRAPGWRVERLAP